MTRHRKKGSDLLPFFLKRIIRMFANLSSDINY